MNPEFLMKQPAPIPAHAFMALAALCIGAAQLVAPKGTPAHRLMGWVWVVLLAGVAISGLFITSFGIIGPFSPIHLLSIYALVQLWLSMRAIRAGNVTAHRKYMRGLYIYALVIAGVFTFFPGRVMHTMLTGS